MRAEVGDASDPLHLNLVDVNRRLGRRDAARHLHLAGLASVVSLGDDGNATMTGDGLACIKEKLDRDRLRGDG